MTAYKMNFNPAFHCLALAVMLALSVQAEDEIQGPTIKGVTLEEDAVQLDVDFSNPFVCRGQTTMDAFIDSVVSKII